MFVSHNMGAITSLCPTTIWLGPKNKSKAAKGYKRDDLYEAWERYL